MPLSNLTPQQLVAFYTNGYMILKDFCSPSETKNLLSAASNGAMMAEMDGDSDDNYGQNQQQSWCNAQDDSTLTYLTHSERVVKLMAQLLDSDTPVCHMEAKYIEKKPKGGACYAWHQDYAWWHANQLLFPDQVISIAIALTDINTISGCSQVIKGSHKMGRVDHGFGQDNKCLGADCNMVNNALDTMELVHIELEPGDAICFHSNLLHRSDINSSGLSTWCVVSTYASQQNLLTNNTFATWHLPIEVVPNEAVIERQTLYLSGKESIVPKGGNVDQLSPDAIQVLRAS